MSFIFDLSHLYCEFYKLTIEIKIQESEMKSTSRKLIRILKGELKISKIIIVDKNKKVDIFLIAMLKIIKNIKRFSSIREKIRA